MHITLTADDLANLSQPTRNEIIRYLGEAFDCPPNAAPTPVARDSRFATIHMTDVEDITFKHIGRWMDGLPDNVRLGVRIIAECGPVIDARLLREQGVDIRRFQTATTRRTRALTGEKRGYFLGSNTWNGLADPEGKYAVSPITYQSIRRYFELPV